MKTLPVYFFMIYIIVFQVQNCFLILSRLNQMTETYETERENKLKIENDFRVSQANLTIFHFLHVTMLTNAHKR
jgi:hypothetical protein